MGSRAAVSEGRQNCVNAQMHMTSSCQLPLLSEAGPLKKLP